MALSLSRRSHYANDASMVFSPREVTVIVKHLKDHHPDLLKEFMVSPDSC